MTRTHRPGAPLTGPWGRFITWLFWAPHRLRILTRTVVVALVAGIAWWLLSGVIVIRDNPQTTAAEPRPAVTVTQTATATTTPARATPTPDPTPSSDADTYTQPIWVARRYVDTWLTGRTANDVEAWTDDVVRWARPEHRELIAQTNRQAIPDATIREVRLREATPDDAIVDVWLTSGEQLAVNLDTVTGRWLVVDMGPVLP